MFSRGISQIGRPGHSVEPAERLRVEGESAR